MPDFPEFVNGFSEVTDEQYFSDPCFTPSLSASCAKSLITKSAAHARLYHPRLGGVHQPTTSEMDYGSAIHKLLLECGNELHIIDAPDYRRAAAQEERDAARTEGKIPILAHEHANALLLVEAVRPQLAALRIDLQEGAIEQCAMWTERAFNGNLVQCRGKMDHVSVVRATINDLKTTRCAHPLSCQRNMIEYGYDIQGAAYTSALQTIRPDLAGRVRMVFLFVERTPPYCLTPVLFGGSMKHHGEKRWSQAVDLWEYCLRENDWPGYATDFITLEAPQWALYQQEVAA